MSYIEIHNGVYTSVFDEATGRFYALRYGEECYDFTGQGFVRALHQELETKLSVICKLTEQLRYKDNTIFNYSMQAYAMLQQHAELSSWKESALAIALPYQDIAKELNIGLGESIHDKILPSIIALKAEIDALQKQEL